MIRINISSRGKEVRPAQAKIRNTVTQEKKKMRTSGAPDVSAVCFCRHVRLLFVFRRHVCAVRVTASAIVADAVSRSHVLKIDGYSFFFLRIESTATPDGADVLPQHTTVLPWLIGWVYQASPIRTYGVCKMVSIIFRLRFPAAMEMERRPRPRLS